MKPDRMVTIRATGKVIPMSSFETQKSQRSGAIVSCDVHGCGQAVYISCASLKQAHMKGTRIYCADHRFWKSGPNDPSYKRSTPISTWPTEIT